MNKWCAAIYFITSIVFMCQGVTGDHIEKRLQIFPEEAAHAHEKSGEIGDALDELLEWLHKSVDEVGRVMDIIQKNSER